jgi:hypothetical protein
VLQVGGLGFGRFLLGVFGGALLGVDREGGGCGFEGVCGEERINVSGELKTKEKRGQRRSIPADHNRSYMSGWFF